VLSAWRIVFVAALFIATEVSPGTAAAVGECTIPLTVSTPDHCIGGAAGEFVPLIFSTPDRCIGECGRQQGGIGQAGISKLGVSSTDKPDASTKTLTMPLPGALALFGSVLFGGIIVVRWRKRRDRSPVSIIPGAADE
jgi:hypothetical protein